VKRIAIFVGFLELTIVSAVALWIAFQWEDNFMVLLTLTTLLIGLAGMGFIVMSWV
jgi:hypothetical protein